MPQLTQFGKIRQAMDCFYRSHLAFSCIFIWSVAIFRTTAGSSITWHEPPPSETVTDTTITSTTNTNLTKGSFNEELCCNFSLTADMNIFAVSFELGDVTVASYLDGQYPTVTGRFVSRFNVTWVPSKLTLIVFNVTNADKGEYRCRVQARSEGLKAWLRIIKVDLLVQAQITNVIGKTVTEGGNVTLRCLAEGNPTPTIKWTRLSDHSVVTMPLTNIRRQNASVGYRCTADNGVKSPATRDVFLDVHYPTEATGPGENAIVADGVVKTFTCPVDGNPEPGIEWYSENNGRILSNGKQLEARESGCYTCVASNNIGPPVNITYCLKIINASLTTVPPSTILPGGEVEAKVMIKGDYSDFYRNLDSGPSKKFVAWFVLEMDKIYMNMPEYNWTLVTGLRPGSVIVHFILRFKTDVTREKGLKNLWVAISSNGTFGGIEAEYLSDESATSHTPASPKPAVSASPPWTIVGAVAGGVVLLAILVGVLIWWVHKRRKYRKDTKNEVRNSDLGRQDDEGGYSQVPGAYAQSGPPAANGTNGAAAEQQLEGATAISNYAVVDKSKKKKKLREEVPPVYAEVDKSKKKKKKIDDKNLYETLDEPKKAKIPGELLYADLGDFQNRAVSTVSISPQPLSAIKKPEAYERTDYADIAQFLKGNTTSPQNGGNEDTEWKPERPSKKKIQGKDNETPI